MSQITLRASEELIDRVRHAAEREGQSMNEYVTRTLDARTNPQLAGTEAERIRERLAQAGLLADVGPLRRSQPDAAAFARARAKAGQGTPLSDIVSEERR